MSEPIESSSAIDLSKTPIHLGDKVAVPVQGFNFDGESFGAYANSHCEPDQPHRLMFIEVSPVSWSSWECHQEADEVVIVLEGEGLFLQRASLDDEAVVTQTPFGPGTTIINPKGVWHTADIAQPMKAIYLTPCPGTVHEPR